MALPFDWTGPVLQRPDVTALDEEALLQLVQRDAQRRFDLERGPLMRVSLYSRGHADHVLLLSVHHVVADFWSLSVLVHELLVLYRSEVDGVPAPLPEPPPVTRTTRSFRSGYIAVISLTLQELPSIPGSSRATRAGAASCHRAAGARPRRSAPYV